MKENEGTSDSFPRFGIVKPIQLSPDFTIYTADQGQIVVASGQKLYKDLHRGPYWWSLHAPPDPVASGLEAPSPTTPMPQPFGPRITNCPPLEKILQAPMVYCTQTAKDIVKLLPRPGIDHHFFSDCQRRYPIRRGNPFGGGAKYSGGCAIFNRNRHLSWRWYEIGLWLP